MTKAEGPEQQPDLWQAGAHSQVFSTAGLSAPLFLHLFYFFHHRPPFPPQRLPLLLSLPVSFHSSRLSDRLFYFKWRR